MLLITFGLPGAGKTYVGQAIAKHFGFTFFDGDQELPDEMKAALSAQGEVTWEMVDVFFNRLIKKIVQLQKKHTHLVVAQTFIREKYRQQVLAVLPEARFVFITANDEKRKKRIVKRADYPLEYLLAMTPYFDPPAPNVWTIENTEDGTEQVIQQLSDYNNSYMSFNFLSNVKK